MVKHSPGSGARASAGLWLAAGSVAFLFCMYHLSATLVDGQFLPADPDSFYHARRILDAIADPLGMYQFDSRIHAPEGSWLTWPWAFDMMMAALARGLLGLTGARDAMTVLAFVAPAWVFLNAALFLGIASRLRLSMAARLVAMWFFSILPLTQALHRVGMLDHHYLEFTFVLASLYFGLGWFTELQSRGRAVALGVLLGVAPAFQNGLFILQLPVLLTVAWLWVLKRPIERAPMIAFALTLIGVTALALLPSEPFRRGEFSYYLHSWFHLYVACCIAALCTWMTVLRFSVAPGAVAVAAALAMAAGILPQIELGRDFLFARFPFYDRIGELGNIPDDIAHGRLWRLTLTYSPLLWLLPLGIAGLLVRLRRDSRGPDLYFLIHVLIGSFLLLQTFRLHYFGTFALILPLCRWIDDAWEGHPLRARRRRLALAGVAMLMLPCVIALQLKLPVGGDYQYMLARGIYPALQAACARSPGVVLAEHNQGHYVRFHSECSVIANNFITTPQHVAKIFLSEELLETSIAEVRRRAPYVRYLLVQRADDLRDARRDCGIDCPENAGWRRRWLLADPAAEGLRLIAELRAPRGSTTEPYARLFEILSSR